MTDIRFIPEWEDCRSVLMALPHAGTDWAYMLDDIRRQYHDIIAALTTAGEHVVLLCDDTEDAAALLADIDSNALALVQCEYNDTWTRDYGPLTVVKDGRLRALDFGFNGWGLKFASDRDNLVNLRLHERGIISGGTYRNERDFTLEGGSVESDGHGTVLTTSRCLCSPNRNGGKPRQELNETLASRLGADHVLWLDYGALDGDDTDSHIDTLARLCPDDVILFTGCRDLDDPHFEELLKMRAQLSMFRTPDGRPYNLVELPLPRAAYDPEDGSRLPATYSNYLVTPRNVFVPTYDDPMNDTLACQTIRIAFPQHNIVPVDCRQLIRQHGSLHCATMQIPDGIFNYDKI